MPPRKGKNKRPAADAGASNKEENSKAHHDKKVKSEVKSEVKREARDEKLPSVPRPLSPRSTERERRARAALTRLGQLSTINHEYELPPLPMPSAGSFPQAQGNTIQMPASPRRIVLEECFPKKVLDALEPRTAAKPNPSLSTTSVYVVTYCLFGTYGDLKIAVLGTFATASSANNKVMERFLQIEAVEDLIDPVRSQSEDMVSELQLRKEEGVWGGRPVDDDIPGPYKDQYCNCPAGWRVDAAGCLRLHANEGKYGRTIIFAKQLFLQP